MVNRNRIAVVSVGLGLILAAAPVFAVPNRQVAHLAAPGVEKTLVLPPAAAHASVISLGQAVDPGTGEVVEGIAFIHRRHVPAKGGNSRKGGPGAASSCYSFLAKDAKWKEAEPWLVNGANSEGLDPVFVFDNLTADISKWENAAGADILGNGALTGDVLVVDLVSPDNLNEVYFGEIADPGVIAVTVVWGVFYGPPSNRKLVEWDMVFDQTDFDWSAAGEAGKMDFENIATHELGHAVGLGHPDNSCVDETMYAYADYGETKKRDLNAGDIAGIAKLY